MLSFIQHENVDIKIEGLKRLQKFANKKAIPILIDALEQSNHPAIGSEEATLHKIYQKNLSFHQTSSFFCFMSSASIQIFSEGISHQNAFEETYFNKYSIIFVRASVKQL